MDKAFPARQTTNPVPLNKAGINAGKDSHDAICSGALSGFGAVPYDCYEEIGSMFRVFDCEIASAADHRSYAAA
jgi:hypothetical protein